MGLPSHQHMGIFLEFLVAPQAGSQLKHGNGVRVPSVLLAILAEGINAFMFQYGIRGLGECVIVHGDRVCRYLFQADTTDVAGGSPEVSICQIPA